MTFLLLIVNSTWIVQYGRLAAVGPAQTCQNRGIKRNLFLCICMSVGAKLQQRECFQHVTFHLMDYGLDGKHEYSANSDEPTTPRSKQANNWNSILESV